VKFDNQLRHAVDIIENYQGGLPLHAWLKDYFRAHKQMGSRDRKLLGSLVYSFYRLGHAHKHLPAKDRLLAGLFVCTDQPSDLLRYFRPDWNPQAAIAEKIDRISLDVTDIFPWKTELSPDIDHESFCLSFLRQPDLFIRIRPGHEQTVRGKLAGVGEFIPPSAIRLPNGFPVENHFTPDKEIVVQDYVSQQIATCLLVSKEPEFFWDACAGSGGKSILVHDLYPNLHICASDIRASILQNLRNRFAAAGIRRYTTFLADLRLQLPPASAAGADLILADVPCTGSGTWSRTPEALYFFDPAAIGKYRDRQKEILRHIAPQLAPDATLVYCTCSVFKKENEEMIEWIGTTFGLRPELGRTLTGYDQHADTLFAARFVR
jgi:16S rRNA (cytosine967-C5)-methyltransferase